MSEICIHDTNIKSIAGLASDASDIAKGLTMKRIKLTDTNGGECTIWLNREQTAQLRKALDVLYPPGEPDHAVVYADEHAGDPATVGNTGAPSIELLKLRHLHTALEMVESALFGGESR